MQTEKLTTDQPELAERFDRVLVQTVEAMDASKIHYAFMGGIASHSLARPRSTHDIDVFVRPEDAEAALRSLERHGFRIERTDPSWLYKGWKEGILIDIIFKSKGDIYLDNEVYARTVLAEYHGHKLRMVSPEDLMIIKVSAHSEVCPGHWHDALALLSHPKLDWEYLIRRARRAPRRMLSLLVYAHSNDIWVPKQVIDELYRYVYGEIPLSTHASTSNTGGGQLGTSPLSVSKGPHARSVKLIQDHPSHRVADPYRVAHLHERFAEDSRTNELDIQVEQSDDHVFLRGEVMTEERKVAVEEIAREVFPDLKLESEIQVTRLGEPGGAEEVSGAPGRGRGPRQASGGRQASGVRRR